MIDIGQRDIVLTRFPYSDFSGTKQRPVLVVSNDKINKNSKTLDFIGLAITSKIRRTDYAIQVNQCDLESGSLPKLSEVHCDKIGTIEKRVVAKTLCRLNHTAFSLVRAKLSDVLK